MIKLRQKVSDTPGPVTGACGFKRRNRHLCSNSIAFSCPMAESR